MAISKSAAVAGVLGGGGGAAGTVAVVKYVASSSKQETTNLDQKVETATKEETLVTIREGITNWGKTNGDCSIKVTLTSPGEAKELSGFTEENKGDLKTLFTYLENTEENQTAKDKCAAAGKKDNKFMIVTKETSTNSWSFKEEDLQRAPTENTELKTIKDKITNWGTTNGNCKIKVVFSDSDTQELKDIVDDNKKSDLESLYTALGGDGNANDTAKQNCENNKFLEATKVTSPNNSWTYTKKDS